MEAGFAAVFVFGRLGEALNDPAAAVVNSGPICG